MANFDGKMIGLKVIIPVKGIFHSNIQPGSGFDLILWPVLHERPSAYLQMILLSILYCLTKQFFYYITYAFLNIYSPLNLNC